MQLNINTGDLVRGKDHIYYAERVNGTNIILFVADITEKEAVSPFCSCPENDVSNHLFLSACPQYDYLILKSLYEIYFTRMAPKAARNAVSLH